MSLTLNHTTLTAGTTREERLAAFDKLEQDVARKMLAELRTDLQGKPGVLRLLHTSDASKAMKFQRAGGFKQFFLSSAKLKNTGEALVKLLERAGVDPGQVRDMQKYVNERSQQARGRRGLETSKVVAMLSEALYPTARDTEAALARLGIAGPNERRLLGEGGYGATFKVAYEGQDHVLKLFHEGGEKYRRVLVRDDQHDDAAVLKKLENPAASRRSFEYVDDEELSPAAAGKPQPAAALLQPNNNSLMKAPKDSLDSQDYLGMAAHGVDIYDPYLMRSSSSLDHQSSSSELLRNYIAKGRELDTVQHQKAPAIADPQVARLEPGAKPEPARIVTDRMTLPDAIQAQATGVRLGRSNITHAMRLKDMPGVVQPKMLLVRESNADGTTVMHTVRGGAEFKAWARTRPVAADLVIEGVLMPMAPGKPLLSVKSTGETEEVTANVQTSHMHDLSRQGLEILKGLQSRGFIHGDLKAENMLYDPGSQQLQFIDTDDLKKISKKPGTVLPDDPGAYTLTYLHPMARQSKPCGAGRDLFALGTTLLEASLQARGADEEWKTWQEKLLFGVSNAKKSAYMSSIKSKRTELAEAARQNEFAPDSAEHFALTCIAEALEYEENRIDHDMQHQFERYTPDNANHPLNKVSQHPFLAVK